MKNDKEEWIDEVFNSMKGSQRAKPSDELYANIIARIDSPDSIVISMQQWSMAAAAAILLLIVNASALTQWSNSPDITVQSNTIEYADNQQLLSIYNIYDL